MAEPFAPYAGIEGAALTGGEGGDLLQKLLLSVLQGTAAIPKNVIDAAAKTAPPGLRREDYTDAPAPGGLTQTWQPGDEQRGAALEGAMLSMGGAAPFGVPARAGEAVLGSGPARKVGDDLLALHNTRPERLQKADQIGGLAVPSTAIVKPGHGFSSFGDVSLVADPAFVTPGRGNPVFASDVYSPRFPSLNDEGTKIFKGFTDMGNRRYSPLTLDNIVREMKGNVRGGEGGMGMYGAGGVRSAVTPQFRSLKEIQGAADKIVPKEKFASLKEGANEELVNLADKFKPFSKYSGNDWQHTNDFASMLGEYAGSGLRPMNEHYKNLPPELLDEARGFLSKLRNMPTEYFEAKPQRGVRIGEFKGALVPDREMDVVAPILEKHGIGRIESYPAGDSEARRLMLQKFRDLFFGAAPVGALGAGVLRRGDGT